MKTVFKTDCYFFFKINCSVTISYCKILMIDHVILNKPKNCLKLTVLFLKINSSVTISYCKMLMIDHDILNIPKRV